MKTKISKIAKLSLFILLFVFFGFKTVSAATWAYYGYSIPYEVVNQITPTGELTISPNTCDIAVGASTCDVTGATWITNNTTDPKLVDGNTSNVLSNLENNGTALQVWASYPWTTFSLQDGDTVLSTKQVTASCVSGSEWGGKNNRVCVATGAISGSLTISPNSCVIASNQSTCTVTGATWTTSGATSPELVDANTGNVLSTLANNSTPLEVYVAYPSTTYYLKDGSTTLDTKGATASCAFGTSWGGSSCVPSIVNGVCAVTHFNCNAGTSTNNAGTGPWTWNCVGQNGGSTASCFEDVGGGGGGKPQCSDGNDNDSDGFIDDGDPGCHSDKDPNNDTSYLPNKTSERDTIKIKEKEI